MSNRPARYNSLRHRVSDSREAPQAGEAAPKATCKPQPNGTRSRPIGLPYHGRFYIDPESGIVVRMITQAELKPTDVVHQQDTRVDYGPVKVGDNSLVLPVRTVIATEVVPNGDSQAAGRYSTRNTFFIIEYKDYNLAGSTAQK